MKPQSAKQKGRKLQQWVRDKLIEPEIVYGYFKCHNKDRKLLVENPNGDDVELEFPRSTKSDHLCLTDYFGDDDIVAFQSVTVGTKVSDVLETWNDEDKYTDAYYLHGLAVETAEAMAEWINHKIKTEF